MESKRNLNLSPELVQKMQALIREGWFKDENDFIETAARYYLERHSEKMWAEYVEHEVKAGLYETF